MGKYEVETDQGNFLVETEDQDFTSPLKSDPSFAGRVSGFVSKTAMLPITFPKVQYETGKDVLTAGVRADERYPAENLLPPVLAGGGAIAGGMSGMPFGATVGAGIGGQVGKTAQEYISALRGNQPVSATMPEAITGTLVEGGKQAGYELGATGAFRFLKALGAGKLAKEGMKKFVGKLGEIFKPEAAGITEKAFNKIKDIPVVDTAESETVKTIGDIFSKRGISAQGQVLSPIQAKNFADAGMTADDIRLLNESLASVRKSASRIAKGKAGVTLESELATTPLRKYQELGNVLNDLDKPNLTYERLRQIRQRIGDVANLDKPDISRTPIEKLYGVVYHNLGLDMAKTAEKEGLLKVHNQVMVAGRKFHQEKLFENIIQQSTTRTKGVSRIKYSDLANELKSYTEDELTRKFGEDAKYVRALRDLAETHAETFSRPLEPSVRLGTGGYATETFRVAPVARFRTPEYVDKILKKYLGEEGLKEYKNVLFNNLKTPQEITANVGRTVGSILPPMFNQYENR